MFHIISDPKHDLKHILKVRWSQRERERRRREPIMLEPGEFGENVENSTKKY